MSVEQSILKVFKDVLELEGEVNPKDLNYNVTENWTSLAHINLVSTLESEFDIMLDTQDILEMSSYDKAVEIVRKATNAN